MKEEIWKPVKGKEDYAEVSNLGQIHRFERIIYSGRGHKSKRIQEEEFTYGNDNGKGYLYACIGGVKKGVHVWVYMTFYNCDIQKGLEVNHIDENPKNNRLDNLNLLSHGDNVRWGTGISRMSAALKNNPKSSKAVQALNPKTLEVVMEFPSAMEAERQFGFNQSNVAKCCNGKRKTAYGYIWRFKENAQE